MSRIPWMVSLAFLATLVPAQSRALLDMPNQAASGVTPASVAAKPHPRTLPESYHLESKALTQEVAKDKKAEQQSEPEAVDGGTPAPAIMRDIQNAAFAEEGRILRLALSWRSNGDAVLEDAKRRALRLAEWSPLGATRYFVHDQAGRAVAWTLALAYDWLYDQWSDAEKRLLIAAIKPRVEEMLSPPVKGLPTGWAGLDWGRKLERWPYDSHGAVTMARLAVICTVLVGEDPLFDRCFQEVVPRYLARPIPWGGADGGYPNGTTYAQWDVLYTHFIVWDLLKSALGVDLWQTPWTRGYGRYIAYFLPPGTPTGLFGDAAEAVHRDVWATQAKAYAAHLPSPLADWYARNQLGDSPVHLARLLAPARDWSAVPDALPAGTPHALHLADIGWVAMHSDLGDRARTSVYFKSSPFGSYNHSHADQNSFVIHSRGQAIAIDSGVYDAYGSRHWKNWYKQTQAHNTITFDGGQGQLHDTMEAKGRITYFTHQAGYDIATGDALAAFGGALTRATRSLVYVRPNVLLVYDSLASETPRAWEWNLHSPSQLKERGKRAIEIEQDGVRLCATLLDAPEGAFAQTSSFTVEPQRSHPRQWHARYTSHANTANTVFVALLDVGCRRPEVSLRREGARSVVSLAGQRFVFEENGQAGVVP